MSLYYTEKLLYNLNRNSEIRKKFDEDSESVLKEYKLNSGELEALRKPDIGYLYVEGVNGQLLMHYAGLFGYSWPDYIEALRDGIKKYGPVKAGLYTMKDGLGAI